MKDLSKMSAAELEAEANRLLYGDVKVPPRLEGTQYQLPKQRNKNSMCVDCKKWRHPSSGQRCRACYLKKAAKKNRGAVCAETYLQMLETSGFDDEGNRVAVTQADE